MKKISRRTFLNVMGAAGEAGALAACGGSSSGSSAAGASSAAAGGAVNGGAYAPFILTVDWLGWLCYLSTLRSSMPHTQIASIRITTSGNKFSSWNVLSAITLYPHEAGKIFPTISNAFGSNSIGNIIPESMIEGRKMR